MHSCQSPNKSNNLTTFVTQNFDNNLASGKVFLEWSSEDLDDLIEVPHVLSFLEDEFLDDVFVGLFLRPQSQGLLHEGKGHLLLLVEHVHQHLQSQLHRFFWF